MSPLPIRSQESPDSVWADASFETATRIDADDPRENTTRQEFKADSDVNRLLKQYGAGIVNLQTRQPVFGEFDFSLDRLGALEMVQRAQDAFVALPEEFRKRYPTVEDLLAAVQSGELAVPEPNGRSEADSQSEGTSEQGEAR